MLEKIENKDNKACSAVLSDSYLEKSHLPFPQWQMRPHPQSIIDPSHGTYISVAVKRKFLPEDFNNNVRR